MKRERGQPRRVTDADVQRLRDWKPFIQVCREIGIGRTHGKHLRSGKYQHKSPSP